MADVFLSYARDDEALAERLARDLEAGGYTVWFDRKLRGGAEFSNVIEREIGAASHVIVIWTAHSIVSHWVRDEASIARDQGKLVPIAIGGAVPPIGFRQFQAVDLTGWHRHRQHLPAALLEALADGEAAPQAPVAEKAGTGGGLSRRGVAIAGGAALLVGAGSLGAWRWYSAGGASNREVSLLVMPLQSSDDAGESATLAAGITEELINRLRRVPGLKVATGGREEAPSGVATLRGTVRRNGDQLRVSSRLEAADGQVLWSDNFDRAVGDLFAVQEEIARAVANALSVSLDVGIESSAFGGTDNPEAYANYVQGRATRWDQDGSIPRGYLERAVKLDPGYVKAQAELAVNYGLSLYNAATPAEADRLLSLMDSASDDAIRQAPGLWMGYASRGWYDLARQDFVAADGNFNKALSVDPGNDPELLDNVAFGYIQFGRRNRAAELRRAKAQIDPIFRDQYVVGDLVGRRDFEGAIAAANDKLSTSGNDAGFDVYWAYYLSGKPDKAREVALANTGVAALPQIDENTPDKPYAELRRWAADRYGVRGRSALARSAIVASTLGHQQLAVDYLRLAFERPGMGIYYLIWHPGLAEARKTPAFETFISDLGMVKAWRESGDWGDFCKPAAGNALTCT